MDAKEDDVLGKAEFFNPFGKSFAQRRIGLSPIEDVPGKRILETALIGLAIGKMDIGLRVILCDPGEQYLSTE